MFSVVQHLRQPAPSDMKIGSRAFFARPKRVPLHAVNHTTGFGA
jgi:hypothetical protein